jgi:serine/threonine protein kinase
LYAEIDGKICVKVMILYVRNILMSFQITDFGLARETTEGEYQLHQGSKIPIRWSAPEVLGKGKVTLASDVYRYFVCIHKYSLGL